jgi:hypothetical protein
MQVGEKAKRITDLELQSVEHISKRQRMEATVAARTPCSCLSLTHLLSCPLPPFAVLFSIDIAVNESSY